MNLTSKAQAREFIHDFAKALITNNQYLVHFARREINLVYTSGAKEDQRASKDINAVTVFIASNNADTISAKPFMKFGLPVLVNVK